MAKPMLVTLPFVLLLLDYWPLGRMQGAGSTEREAGTKQNTSVGGEAAVLRIKEKGKSSKKLAPGQVRGDIAGREIRGKTADDKYQWALIRPLLLEKIPLFALAAISSIVTFVVQAKGGAVTSLEANSAGCSYCKCLCFLYHLHRKDGLAG